MDKTERNHLFCEDVIEGRKKSFTRWILGVAGGCCVILGGIFCGWLATLTVTSLLPAEGSYEFRGRDALLPFFVITPCIIFSFSAVVSRFRVYSPTQMVLSLLLIGIINTYIFFFFYGFYISSYSIGWVIFLFLIISIPWAGGFTAVIAYNKIKNR
jgi:hypothetical protein